jgi:hypothetical protein
MAFGSSDPSGSPDVDGQDEQDPPTADRIRDEIRDEIRGEAILSAKPILPILT